ncbi:MAG: HD domain-containing protein [Elusimicrobiota bacterium]
MGHADFIDKLGLQQDVLRKVRDALGLAQKAHRGQVRDQGTPYIEHPVEMTRILAQELGIREPDLLIAALLHDVLEQSDVPPEDIRERFGDRAASLVLALTRHRQGAPGPKTSFKDYLLRVSRSGPEAVLLKLVDRWSNLKELGSCPDAEKRRKYLAETEEIILPMLKGATHAAARTALAEIEKLLKA